MLQALILILGGNCLSESCPMHFFNSHIIPTYLVPSMLGGIIGTLQYLLWRGVYTQTPEGMIFIVCASASMLFLGLIIFHYQALLRKVMKLEKDYARAKHNIFSQFSPMANPQPNVVSGNPSKIDTRQTDILDIDPLEIDIKKSPEKSNLTNVVQLHSPHDRAVKSIGESNKIIINLQAVIKMKERSVHSYEVLARMESKDGTFKSATEIFDGFKKKAEFHYLDKTILEQTVEVLDCLGKNSDLVMNINISRQTLESKAAFNRFYRILQDHSSICKNLVLEISQQQLSDLSGASANRLFSITELGYRLSIDNCTDYPSLLPLVKEKQIAIVKTPMSRFIDINTKALQMDVKNLMTTCKAHDVPFIVTHVDEGYQLQELIRHDIDFAQGFLFSAPKRPTSKTG